LSLDTELLLPFSRMLHRYKTVTLTFAALLLFLTGANASYASHRKGKQQIAYRTQLGADLDGDHIPESATIRQRGYLYDVSIHFTTGRPKLRLTTYVTEGIAGLSFQTTDVDNDRRGDLIIFSATSIRPIAVWINQGRARFKRSSPILYGGVGRYTGPIYHGRGPSVPDPVGNISIEPLPHVTPAVRYLTFDHETVGLFSQPPEAVPFDLILPQVSPRGPPADASA
jgi:hypothetical protein